MATILIIENDPEIQEYYNELLYDEGYQVINCYSGEDGLAKIKKYDPDLLILDMELGGGITGRDVVIEIKKIKKKLPILVISGKVGMENDPEIATSPNVYRFFVKPVSLIELSKTIEKIFGYKAKTQPTSTKKEKISWEGEKIAGCVLEDCIGQGGSGKVYKAMRLGAPVAVKILPKDALSEEDIARFQREVQTLASLNHPAIINLLDTGQTKNGDFFIVMTYFNGKGVDSILDQKQIIEESEAIEIVRQIAQGMAIAHAATVIHRDLKPSNILYCQEQAKAKIIDFGIARKLQPNQTITQLDCVVGTPFYMSPEQCMAKPIDERSDIYNLGATFYHMVSGQLPFTGESFMQVMMAHTIETIKWSSLGPQTSSPTKKIIEKMMAKEPQHRYRSMEEVAQELSTVKGK